MVQNDREIRSLPTGNLPRESSKSKSYLGKNVETGKRVILPNVSILPDAISVQNVDTSQDILVRRKTLGALWPT